MATCIAPLLTALVVHTALAGTAPPPPSTFTHTRALTRPSAELIAKARTRAPSIRAQMEALERTDVVVYVTEHCALSASEPPAYVRFISAESGTRYLKLTINCWRVSDAVRIQMLGHELQHALEIAAAPHVRDDRTLTGLYLRIGYEVRPRQFETRAARAMDHRVRKELSGRSR
jgi:hypothetical protein